MEEVDEEGILTKRVFWRRVLWSGICLFMLLSVLAVFQYLYKMGEVKDAVVGLSAQEEDIELLTSRRVVVLTVVKWFVPCTILGSVWVNVARWRLRKLKKL